MVLTFDYDCASSILLCAEDNSVLSFDGEEDTDLNSFYDGFLMASFPLQSDECLELLVQREADHLPLNGYALRLQTRALDPSIRRDAIGWICKVHSYYNFGPLSAYLSVNYLDRFLSEYEIPEGKAWMTQLLSVACLSLAAKMEETEVPLSLDLQVGDTKFVFESKTIKRMELLVLSTLKWRMQSVTPFAYIDYFLHSFNDGNAATDALIHRSGELILSIIKGIDFLSFRPSEIAAAVALSVLGESEDGNITKLVTSCKHLDKDRVLSCYEVIQDVALMRHCRTGNASVSSSVALTPNGVLDAAACLSYNSEAMTGNSHRDSYLSPALKRRKICRA